ncbi:MAG: hypothetical protein RIS52_99, partial [Pseudomonadota bacterium]
MTIVSLKWMFGLTVVMTSVMVSAGATNLEIPADVSEISLLVGVISHQQVLSQSRVSTSEGEIVIHNPSWKGKLSDIQSLNGIIVKKTV